MEFPAEVWLQIQFPRGRESLNEPPVLVFPMVVLCVNCGWAQFTVPETELKLIQETLGNDGIEAAN